MQEKKGLVSIILNCFNGEAYLQEAINSVIQQTYNNWELIFWDNQSTDKSKKILNSFKLNKLKYFYSEKHTSLYEARNLAEKKSNGEYIAFIDADDIWEKNKLEQQIKLFENKLVGVVYGNLWIYNEKLKKKKIFSRKNLIKGNINNKILSNYKIGIISSVIRKDVLTNNNIYFDRKYNHIGDFDLFFKLSRICQFDAIQTPVATYRIHGNNLSLKNSEKEISELKSWFRENQFLLNLEQKKHLHNRILSREFINIKLNKSFIETFKFFFNHNSLWKHIKNFLLLIIPLFFLKKFMWYK